ncbi:MAG: hypothetical protein JXA33_26655 [Anaerolineae bacterium]|nr:hypothetical protein [Anaerolineae bacterium]
MEDPLEYVWPSARFYLAEKHGLIPADDADLTIRAEHGKEEVDLAIHFWSDEASASWGGYV